MFTCISPYIEINEPVTIYTQIPPANVPNSLPIKCVASITHTIKPTCDQMGFRITIRQIAESTDKLAAYASTTYATSAPVLIPAYITCIPTNKMNSIISICISCFRLTTLHILPSYTSFSILHDSTQFYHILSRGFPFSANGT